MNVVPDQLGANYLLTSLPSLLQWWSVLFAAGISNSNFKLQISTCTILLSGPGVEFSKNAK